MFSDPNGTGDERFMAVCVASVWNSIFLWSACWISFSWFKLNGSETPPVKSIRASLYYLPLKPHNTHLA